MKSVDNNERLAVRAYCYDMLEQLADLLVSRGGEPETAEVLRALTRSTPALADHRRRGDQRTPEAASFA